MKLKLPARDAKLSDLARQSLHPIDAIAAILTHCQACWRDFPADVRRKNALAYQRGDAVSTPFTDRLGTAFIVSTNRERTETIVRLADEH